MRRRRQKRRRRKGRKRSECKFLGVYRTCIYTQRDGGRKGEKDLQRSRCLTSWHVHLKSHLQLHVQMSGVGPPDITKLSLSVPDTDTDTGTGTGTGTGTKTDTDTGTDTDTQTHRHTDTQTHRHTRSFSASAVFLTHRSHPAVDQAYTTIQNLTLSRRICSHQHVSTTH